MSVAMRSILLSILFVCVGLTAFYMRNNKHPDGTVPDIDFKEAIPLAFGPWKADANDGANLLVQPEIEAKVNKLYSQTLSRTYIDSAGNRMMLSIAYGGFQTSSLKAHRPEVCYVAQGFRIGSMLKAIVNAQPTQVPVMTMIATSATRVEPITYWIRVGEYVTRGWIEQNLAKLSYEFSGRIPDGILVRVSSISTEPASAFQLQEKFVSELLAAVKPEVRKTLIGQSAKSIALRM